MSTNRKIQKVLVALIVGMLCAVPFWGSAQVEKGVTRAGESTKASPVKPYVNEFGKLVCWPRVNSNGKLLTYGPIADTEDADEITSTTAKLHGNILHDGWCNPAGVTTQGFEISTSAEFTTIVKTVTLSPTPPFTPCATPLNGCTCNDNKYSQTVTDLLPGTTYYYRAYATNDCGTGYGDTVQFKTDDDFEVTVMGPEEYVFCITGSESATYRATTEPEISSGTKTYKWYVDGTLVSGATTSTYTRTYTQADAGNHTVKCEISVVGLTRDGSVTTAITVLNPTVNYTGITGNTTICYGENTTLTANATASTGATLSYQWKKNGSVIPDATASSYTTENLTSNATYTCEITATQNGCTSAASTKTVNVTVNNPRVLSATVAPESTEVCAGNPFTLNVNAEATPAGATLSYQWQKNGNNISDATSATYTATPTSPSNDSYTCVVTATLNGCPSEPVNADASVSVIEAASVGTITVANQTICYGSSATLTANVSDNVGNLSYQWATGGSNISGATSSTYTVTPTTTTTYTVYVTATTSACTATGSKTVTVTVLKPTVTFTSITGPEGICDGGTATMTANATASEGATLHYQWSYNNHDISGANSATYTTSTLTGTGNRTYKCTVEAIDGNECTSDEAEMEFTVYIYNPSISNASITPSSQAICAGNSTTLTAHANVNPTTATVSFQWKKNGADISGATSPTYNATEAGTYTCVITATQGGCSKSATTTAATVTVSTPSVGTIALAGQTICGGNTATLTPTISGSMGDLNYQWSTGGNPIPDATSASYTTPELTSTTTYTFSVTATVGTCTDTKNVSATVTVDGPYETEETLEICDCQLPFTFNIGECTFVWTKDAGENNYLTNPTRTCTLKTVKNQCDSIVHITLLTWSAANTVATSCNVTNFRDNETGTATTGLTKLTDIDGNEYSVVQIGDQCWMKENLRVKKFDDGRANPDLSPVSDVDAHGNRADIYYVPSSGKVFTKNVCDQSIEIPFNSDYEKQYGLYYNWYTAMGTNNPAYDMHNVQGICPHGWHLPDTAEWQTLERAAGFYGQHSEINHVFVGQSAIHLVTGCEWKQSTVANSPGDYNAFGRNDLNFSARPAGCFLDADHPDVDGSNYYKNTVAYTGIWTFFWSSTRFHKWKEDGSALDPAYDDAKAAYNYDITFNLPGIARDVNGRDYLIGRSVRCVRDMSSMKVRINSKAETTSTSYTITGEVYDLGSTTCAERGVCYATHTYPSVSDTKVIATGTPDLGTYTCVVPVTSGVKYYVRAYAKDAAGNYVYSNEVTVPDVCPSTTVQDGDGNSYTTIAIGTQCWTRRSIHTTKYADGTDITFGSPTSGDLYSSTTGYYYTPYINRGTLPGDAAGRITTWGYLYNWAAATRGVSGTNVQGVCPNGWHIPTIEDWTTLDNYVKGKYSCSGGSAKALSSVNTWQGSMNECAPGYDAEHTNNKSGFNAYPAGIYDPTLGYVLKGQNVNFWASNNSYYVTLGNNEPTLVSSNTLSDYKRFAFSVRCVKN
jgi:uncharacterized protein (TIGR02145 family)